MALHVKWGDDMYKFRISIIAGVLISLAACSFADEYFSAPSAQLVYGFYHQAVCDDFDNDGDIDIVALHPSYSGLHYVSLILNDGNCRFSPVDSINIGERGKAIHLRELNGDGHKDVVIAKYDNSLGVLLNNGNGSFQPIQYYGCPLGAGWVTSVDLDDDNDYDLIITGSSGYISVLKNNGAGSFDPYEYNDIGYLSVQIISDDFDNDGDLDLATVNPYNNCISVIMNTGNGLINTPQVYQSGVYPLVLSSADMNNDSFSDIVASSVFGYVFFFFNNGDGTFQNPDSMFVDYDVMSINSADLNNDGDNDLIIATLNYQTLPTITDDVFILSNNGDGTFADPVNYRIAVDPSMAVAADFNNDNFTDILVTGLNYVFMINNGDGTFPSPDKYVVGEYPYALAMTDLDRDNDLDLAITRPYSGFISFLLNDGDGLFTEIQDQNSWGGLFSITSADFDRDRRNEIAVVSAGNGRVYVYMNNENSALKIHGVNVNDSPYTIITDDFNNDGFYDLATSNWNSFSVILNENGYFFSATNYPIISYAYLAICAADFNNDNFVDLALIEDIDSSVFIWFNNGDGTFDFGASYLVGNYPKSICSGDFDNDLDIDLAVTDIYYNGVWVLLNAGNGVFLPPTPYFDVGHCASSIVAFDLEMDGDIDLATAGGGDCQILSVLINNGDATFQDAINYAVGDCPLSLRAGDLDNDGMIDLAFNSVDGNYVNVLLNQLEPVTVGNSNLAKPKTPHQIIRMYPNPFNNQIAIKYELPYRSHVKVVIYDILGRKVSTLIDSDQKAGKHQVNWDARNQASGLYFSKIQIGEHLYTEKMILMK
jgi:hypothetical protein